ncbi:MAG: hypothetical protein JF612_00060 [Planctomycetia bacterium]|jgi:hypothetical protein|nr:hypothetical protein [Planctomycetia bacterium]
MAIDVTCPSCLTRFQVSDKFAGKSGPCPKCKKTIKVPEKKAEVVIHAPEVSGPKDSTGVAVLKPIARKETRLSMLQIVAICGSVVFVLAAAVAMRVVFKGHVPSPITILGSILLGPALAFAGYTFLRDDELEPYRGREVLLRSLACGLAYAAIWGAYWLIIAYWFNFKVPTGWQPSWAIMAGAIPAMVAIGTVAAQASLELELTASALNYAMYLITTVLLRFVMGMDPRWQS